MLSVYSTLVSLGHSGSSLGYSASMQCLHHESQINLISARLASPAVQCHPSASWVLAGCVLSCICTSILGTPTGQHQTCKHGVSSFSCVYAFQQSTPWSCGQWVESPPGAHRVPLLCSCLGFLGHLSCRPAAAASTPPARGSERILTEFRWFQYAFHILITDHHSVEKRK